MSLSSVQSMLSLDRSSTPITVSRRRISDSTEGPSAHGQSTQYIRRLSQLVGLRAAISSAWTPEPGDDVEDSSAYGHSYGVSAKQNGNVVQQDQVEAKYDSKYSLFLTFHSKEDQSQFHEFNKNKIYAPVFWFFIILVGGIDMSRLSLTEMFQGSKWFQTTCSLSVASIVVFFIFAISQLGRLTGFYFGDNFPIQRFCIRITREVFFDHTEDAITILFSLAMCSFLIARVVQGPCPYSNTMPKTTIFCNPEADSLSPPMDTVIAAYIQPLVLHMAIKGISKWAMLLAWSIATATVMWSIIYYGGWLGIYSILDSLFFLLVSYETHRMKMLVFLQTKYELSVEKKRRQKAELENLLRDEMLAEEVLKRTELEKDETLRQKRWAELPVHSGTPPPPPNFILPLPLS